MKGFERTGEAVGVVVAVFQSDVDDLCAIRLQFGAGKRKTAAADILAERITAQDPEHTLKMVRRRICDRRDLFIIDLVGQICLDVVKRPLHSRDPIHVHFSFFLVCAVILPQGGHTVPIICAEK